MIKIDHRELSFYQFASFNSISGIIHAVTTKWRGGEVDPGARFPLGGNGGAQGEVPQNLEILRKELGLRRVIHAHQVHGDEILAVMGDEDLPAGKVDGLCTDRPGVGILIKQADCQAVALAAPGRAVANFHVGWRGNVADMPGKGVRFFCERYGLKPTELYAAVSPGLGPCCAEFINHKEELGKAFLPYRLNDNHFDLWRVTKDQLTAAGVRPERIEIAGICTKCGEEFFSYRREHLSLCSGTVLALEGGGGK